MNNLSDVTNKNKDLLEIIEANPDMYREIKYKRGNVIHEFGSIITEYWYIKNGLLKGYFNDKNIGREVIVNFLWINMFLPIELHQKRPIHGSIEVLEDAIIYKISEENFNKLRKEHPILNDIVKDASNKMMDIIREKSVFLNYNNAQIRYDKAKEIYPFLPRLKDEDVGYFLGLSTRTVSDIKAGKQPREQKEIPKKKNRRKKK